MPLIFLFRSQDDFPGKSGQRSDPDSQQPGGCEQHPAGGQDPAGPGHHGVWAWRHRPGTAWGTWSPPVLLLPCPALVALLGKCPLSHMLEQRGWTECLDPQHSHLEHQVLGKTCLIQLKSILQERNYTFCVVTACQIPMIGTSQNCFVVI